MERKSCVIERGIERVLDSYKSAESKNKYDYEKGKNNATEEYIYPNQKEDAHAIVDEFYKNKRRVISITKKTKVGMDGLMIEVAKLMCTHPENSFVVDFENVRIITGMSNRNWETEMKYKSPDCFKDKIFHHGKLKKSGINNNLQNALIIIDEIDTGDNERQVLHRTLKEAGVLNVDHMKRNNNRFIFASATMFKELYDLYGWGELHMLYQMTIPPNYIGHIDFLDRGIIKEFYALNTPQTAEQWINEDILDNYGTDFRVHIVRVKTNGGIIYTACSKKGVDYRSHESSDKIPDDVLKELFEKPLKRHVVLGIKGYFRRANLIPNSHKLRIAATHELYTKLIDNNVQVQGLPGRMTGYWRHIINNGHKTGPHRTSLKAIEEYEMTYNDPFGPTSYHSSGFKKNKGRVVAKSTMISPKNISGLVPTKLPILRDPRSKPIVIIKLDTTFTIDSYKNKKNTEKTMEIIKMKDIETYNLYKDYKHQCWKMESETECVKWGLTRMKQEGAYSTETNVKVKDKNANILMVYLHDDELILNPWNGTALNINI